MGEYLPLLFCPWPLGLRGKNETVREHFCQPVTWRQARMLRIASQAAGMFPESPEDGGAEGLESKLECGAEAR